MLHALVEERFFPDAAPLVPVSWPRERRPGRQARRTRGAGLLHQIGQLIDDESSCCGFSHGQSPFPVDDQLDGQGPAHRGVGGRGDASS